MLAVDPPGLEQTIDLKPATDNASRLLTPQGIESDPMITQETKPRVPLDSMRDLLSQTRLKDLSSSGHQDVVTLEHDMSIGHALRVLAKHNILSAPLVISPGLEDVQSTFAVASGPTLVDWVDISDILREFLRQLRSKSQQLPGSMLQLMRLLEKEGPSFTEKSLITMVGGADRTLVFQPDTATSVLDAVKDMFLVPSMQLVNGVEVPRQVHRLAIFDAHGFITGIISQMDVIRFLHRHAHALGSAGSMSLQQLGMLHGKPPVVTVEPHLPTILAYDRLQQAGVRGAAVVTDKGELMANISVSDLRSIQPEHLGVLALPVAEFLALLHGTSYLGYSQRTSEAAQHPFFAPGGDTEGVAVAGPFRGFRGGKGRSSSGLIYKPVTCTADATLTDLLGMVMDNHVHRVYVMEDAGPSRRVRAVLTLTDVLNLLGEA